MGRAVFGCTQEDKVNAYAAKMAKAMGRGDANIEDQLSAGGVTLAGEGRTADQFAVSG